MRKVLTLSIALCLISVFAFGQDWEWELEAAFPDTSDFPQSYGQGLAVDGEGKIWYTSYYSSDSLLVPEHHDTTAAGVDTVILAEYRGCRAIYVYNPDGSPASFSPIKIVTVGSYVDSLWWSNRGLRTDPDGNVVNGSWAGYHKIDYLTGEGLARLVPYPTDTHSDNYEDWDAQSVTAASFDDEGNMFVCTVLPGYPIKAFGSDWELIDDVIAADNHAAYARTIEVSGDANDIYYCGFTSGHGYIRFHSDAGLDGDYTTQIDTLLTGLSVEAVGWQPVTGYLWGGNSGGAGFTNCTFYGWDPVTEAVVDSFSIPGVADLGAKPRGIDFSADGNTAYVTFFNTWDSHAIYKLTKLEVGIWEVDRIVPYGFKLDQNYPNPFNPTTTITFDLIENGLAKLTVYDMIGRQVAVLVDEPRSAGQHKVLFDATGLASGMYIYQLEFNHQVVSKRMMFLK